MGRIVALLLALAVVRPAAAAPRERLRPPPLPSSDGEAPAGEVMVMNTPDGQLRWAPGASDVEVRGRDGSLLHRIALASLGRRPAGGEQVSYRALLPPRGDGFLVVEEARRDFGLHTAERLSADKPKFTLVRSVLRLVDESSRVLWERPTEGNVVVGGRSDPQHLRIAPNGTVAILLEDADPWGKTRPLLSVVDPHGRESLRLDYTAWQQVDEFALAPDGKALVVDGYGMVPEDGTAGRAIGYYRPGKGPLWIKALPRLASPRLRLEQVRADGWSCCVQAPRGWLAFDRSGSSTTMSGGEMRRRFGVRP